MRKISILAAMVILAGVISFSSQAFGQGGSKVLMIPREGYSSDLDLMIKMEVGVMNLLLKKAGFQVDIATTSGRAILGSTEKIEKVMRLMDINLDDYAGIIMPCMAVGTGPGPAVSQDAIALVKKAVSDGKPVAAQQGSIIILAEAGVLKGKKYVFQRDPLKAKTVMPITKARFEGAIYSGQGVVQDGKIVTSAACPNIERTQGLQNGTVELSQKFIAAIKSK